MVRLPQLHVHHAQQQGARPGDDAATVMHANRYVEECFEIILFDSFLMGFVRFDQSKSHTTGVELTKVKIFLAVLDISSLGSL